MGRLHGLSDDLIRRRAERFLELLELSDRLGSRIASLSKGMRQKLLLTSALLHDPELIVLDEPLSGLDVNATILVKELIRVLARNGKTVFYCSHVMDVVERVCDLVLAWQWRGLAAKKVPADLRLRPRPARLDPS